MKNTKLISLLRSFSAKEAMEFEDFLNSPFFNNNNHLLRLYRLIREIYLVKRQTDMTKADFFSKLFPGQSFDDKKLRYLMSDLLKLGYRFLLVRKSELSNPEASLALIEELAERNLDKHYLQWQKKRSNSLKNANISGVNQFYSKIRQADIEQKRFSRLYQRRYDDNIQYGSDYLNRYFVLKKLKYACGMLDRQALLKGSYEPDLPENWLEWLIQNKFWNEKIIELYTRVFLSLKEENNPTHFDNLLGLLYEDPKAIAKSDAKELFLYAINYCARKMRKGEDRYIEIALDLYVRGIEERILLENGFLSPWTFGNIVKLALRLERFSWIEKFIEQYKDHLHPEFRENAIQYNLAELYCYKKEFDKALTYLIKVEFSDLNYHLGSRIMLSKIYYELNEEDALLSLMSSFVMFLKRNKKISDSIRKTCLHFCEFLFQIIRGKTDGIEEKIKNTGLLTDREWLLEKAGLH